MKIGYIGLGKMGFNMVERLLEKKYEVVANNRSRESIDKISERGADPAYSIEELIQKLSSETQRIVWLMVPWQSVDEVLDELVPKLKPGDIIIDGGNSPYIETVRRGEELLKNGLNFIDVGVSGGPGGARNGACLMVGGDKDIYNQLEVLFKDLAIENGYGHMGDIGAGHFVKMVHNGIEYGMMQAIGEGFEVMKKSNFNINLEEVASVYNHGSVIESRLIGWLKKAFEEHTEELNDISGEIKHSGEGQWTVEAADRLKVPVTVIKESLNFRINSTGNPSYTGKVVSALRNQFGGHNVSDK